MDIMFWIMIAVIVIAIDVLTSSFIFMWFSLGAIFAIILSFFGVGMLGQTIGFLVVGIATVAVGYPWAKKKFKVTVKKTLTMEEGYIGRVMVATEDMEETSKIKVDGVYWTAFNKGKTIIRGQKFLITGIEGNKLVVSLKEE